MCARLALVDWVGYAAPSKPPSATLKPLYVYVRQADGGYKRRGRRGRTNLRERGTSRVGRLYTAPVLHIYDERARERPSDDDDNDDDDARARERARESEIEAVH